MTIKDLKAKLGDMDENSTIMMQKPDGTRIDIMRADKQGDHFTFWLDS